MSDKYKTSIGWVTGFRCGWVKERFGFDKCLLKASTTRPQFCGFRRLVEYVRNWSLSGMRLRHGTPIIATIEATCMDQLSFTPKARRYNYFSSLLLPSLSQAVVRDPTESLRFGSTQYGCSQIRHYISDSFGQGRHFNLNLARVVKSMEANFAFNV